MLVIYVLGYVNVQIHCNRGEADFLISSSQEKNVQRSSLIPETDLKVLEYFLMFGRHGCESWFLT
jgi:hypothetical protein